MLKNSILYTVDQHFRTKQESRFYQKCTFTIQRSFGLHKKRLSKAIDSAIISVIGDNT